MTPQQVLDLLVVLREAQADAARLRSDLARRNHQEACALAQDCMQAMDAAGRVHRAAVDPVLHGLRLTHVQGMHAAWQRAQSACDQALGLQRAAQDDATGAAVRLHAAQAARRDVHRASRRRALRDAAIDRVQPATGDAQEWSC